jgi:hypothetical protein
MHGVMNRAVQCLITDVWGAAVWRAVAQEAGLQPADLPGPGDAARTARLLATAAAHLGRTPDCLLEDLGTYLVSHPARAGIRRLLRFGGSDFRDFLHSLEDLPERGRLALPDLLLPPISVSDQGAGRYALGIGPGGAGLGPLLTGLLRAMADDYGALVLIDPCVEGPGGAATIRLSLLEPRFATPRAFALSVPR